MIKRIITGIFVFILIILIVLVLGRNFIVKQAAMAGVKAFTGVTLEIKKVDIGLFKTIMEVNGLKLFNPPEFSESLMMSMPEIYLDYDLNAFIKNKKVHIREVRLEMEKFVVIKNKEGKLNIDALKPVEQSKKESQAKKGETPPQKQAQQQIKIDLLALKIGEVIYKDYSQGEIPKIREFKININERYENITNLQAVASLIMVKALSHTAISRLANFDLGPLKTGLSDALKESLGLTKDAGQATGNVFKNIFSFGRNKK